MKINGIKQECVCMEKSEFGSVLTELFPDKGLTPDSFGKNNCIWWTNPETKTYSQMSSRDANEIRCRLAQYFDVGAILSIHEGPGGMWIAYHTGADNEFTLTKTTLPQFLGEVADVFDAYLRENDIWEAFHITNPFDGQIEQVVGKLREACEEQIHKQRRFSPTEAKSLAEDCIGQFSQLLYSLHIEWDELKATAPLKKGIIAAFVNWGLAGDVYQASCRINGVCRLKIEALSIRDAITEAEKTMAEIEFGPLQEVTGRCYMIENNQSRLWEEDEEG